MIPATGVLIGIDYGTVRLGVAVCDRDRIIASGLDTITRKSEVADAAAISKYVTAHKAVGLVLGLPISLNDTEGPKALETRAFGEWLKATIGLPVDYVDERFTSAAAEDILIAQGIKREKRIGHRDRIAAQMILQNYIDGLKKN